MPEWLSSLGRRKTPQAAAPAVLDLLVVEGEDAGQRFTLDASSVPIARGMPRSGQPGAILLRDPTVSTQQATIHVGDNGATIEHSSGATNPTLVNGKPAGSEPLRDGDRIQMGRVVLEVREREGVALGGLNDASAEVPIPTERTQFVDDTTEIRPRSGAGHYLIVIRGLEEDGVQFPLDSASNVIGRDPVSQIHLDVRAVSRRHAEIRREGDRLLLVHHSSTNQTFVNGISVQSETVIVAGDEIRLADRVVLLLRHDADTGADAPNAPEAPEAPKTGRSSRLTDPQQTSLQVRMEEKLARDLEIEEKYAVTGSFLDIDVVGSYLMKEASKRPEHIIVSFERWRSWVSDIVEEFDGMVLNSNGDELMCFFESTPQSVRSGSAILTRLDAFNASDNVLETPFRLRIGVHTGSSLVDRKRGVAYSAVLDVAGHLQKDASVNGLLISEDTLRALPDGAPFAAAGVLEREGLQTFELTEPFE